MSAFVALVSVCLNVFEAYTAYWNFIDGIACDIGVFGEKHGVHDHGVDSL
jgi:hypothetical protein